MLYTHIQQHQIQLFPLLQRYFKFTCIFASALCITIDIFKLPFEESVQGPKEHGTLVTSLRTEQVCPSVYLLLFLRV